MPRNHKVRQGDCVSSVAAECFMLPETVWDAPENEALREERPHLNALAPGDTLVVPDPKERIENAAVDQRHRYVRKGVPEKIKLVLEDEDGKPRKDLDYKIEFPDDTPEVEGKTGEDGKIEFNLPPKLRKATLRLGELDTDKEEKHELEFGCVDPITTVSGVQHRLLNLGYGIPKISNKLDDATKHAIECFQSDAEIDVTGEMDDTTRGKLEERYGS